MGNYYVICFLLGPLPCKFWLNVGFFSLLGWSSWWRWSWWGWTSWCGSRGKSWKIYWCKSEGKYQLALAPPTNPTHPEKKKKEPCAFMLVIRFEHQPLGSDNEHLLSTLKLGGWNGNLQIIYGEPIRLMIVHQAPGPTCINSRPEDNCGHSVYDYISPLPLHCKYNCCPLGKLWCLLLV